MKDPADTHQHPPRANPIQPDKPGSGQSREEPKQGRKEDDAQRQKEQSDTALDNVRKGYD